MNMLASTSRSTGLGGWTVLQLSKIRSNRTVSSSFSLRISATCDDRPHGPSCIYVGPLQTATKETLEALYSQARDAYYRGEPLIVDDMFDRVEVSFTPMEHRHWKYNTDTDTLTPIIIWKNRQVSVLDTDTHFFFRSVGATLKLKWYGSKSVVKYPRCSIRRQSTYADAEEDLSMVFTLASTWTLFFAFGSLACVGPMFYTISLAHQNALNSALSYGSQGSELVSLFMLNTIIFMALGFVIGYPVASASVKVLQGLWRNDLAALKGSCPNCAEEVFAFVKTDNANSPHRAKCHVCECLLEFRTEVEQSTSTFGRQWVYGRIYLVRKSRRQREL